MSLIGGFRLLKLLIESTTISKVALKEQLLTPMAKITKGITRRHTRWAKSANLPASQVLHPNLLTKKQLRTIISPVNSLERSSSKVAPISFRTTIGVTIESKAVLVVDFSRSERAISFAINLKMNLST